MARAESPSRTVVVTTGNSGWCLPWNRSSGMEDGTEFEGDFVRGFAEGDVETVSPVVPVIPEN